MEQMNVVKCKNCVYAEQIGSSIYHRCKYLYIMATNDSFCSWGRELDENEISGRSGNPDADGRLAYPAGTRKRNQDNGAGNRKSRVVANPKMGDRT